MAHTRSKSETFINEQPKAKSSDDKHVVCVFEAGIMKLQANGWVENKNQYYARQKGQEFKAYESDLLPYRLLEVSAPNQPIFKNVKNNEILYIYCHGHADNDSRDASKTQIFLKNYEKNKLDTYTPQQFLKYLKTQELSHGHKTLKIAACYSDKFAEAFSQIAKKDFPGMLVVGYKGQFLVNQTMAGGKLAGLSGDMIILRNNVSKLNTSLFNEDEVGNTIKYAAKAQRVKCIDGEKIPEKVEEKKSELEKKDELPHSVPPQDLRRSSRNSSDATANRVPPSELVQHLESLRINNHSPSPSIENKRIREFYDKIERSQSYKGYASRSRSFSDPTIYSNDKVASESLDKITPIESITNNDSNAQQNLQEVEIDQKTEKDDILSNSENSEPERDKSFRP